VIQLSIRGNRSRSTELPNDSLAALSGKGIFDAVLALARGYELFEREKLTVLISNISRIYFFYAKSKDAN